MASIVIRVTRHPLDAEREQYLKNVFGSDLRIVTEDIPYGDDAVVSVRTLIERIAIDAGATVVAVEAQCPFPVLMKLVDRRRDLGVALIRAQFVREEGGRNLVVGKDENGRDLFKFSHYEELERIVFETRRLEPRQ